MGAGVRIRKCRAPGLLSLLALGCGDAGGATDAGTVDAAPRVKPRTVTIELFKTAERVLVEGADGELTYGPLTDIGGVEACVAQRRPAFASFEPFDEIPSDDQICTMSVEGETVRLAGVPADSDLVITFTKEDYEPATMTFRTDDHDVAAPMWGPSFATTLLRAGASDPWLEPEPRPAGGDGGVLIWVAVVWTGGTPFVPSVETFAAGIVLNLAQGEGVLVELVDAEDRRITELRTPREGPLFLSLPEGLYRMRFSHPAMSVSPVGIGAQYMNSGLPTEARDTIELPVIAGFRADAVVNAWCVAPEWSQGVADLATCTLADGDAGTPP